MDKLNGFLIFIQWLKENLLKIFMALFAPAIYNFVGYLYERELKGILYASVIWLFLAASAFLISFIKYKDKMNRLYQIKINFESMCGELPVAESLEEGLYQDIIAELDYIKRDAIENVKKRENEMSDYYNLWVHQIKTPIAAMKLLLQSQESIATNNSIYDDNNILLRQELFKIEQYAEMVLQFLRLESISSDFMFEEYDLYELAKQAVKKYSISFIGKKLTLNFEPFKAGVITDEKWLSLVIEQVLSNALKYTKQGSITISADTQKKLLIIKDTGIGINSEDLPRIFDKGFTGYNGRMDKRSTGIGLYLCKQVMNRLSSSIWVESEIGKGTAVYMDLNREKYEDI